MSNVAPEHGPTDFGAVGDGGPIPVGQGVRPPMPVDKIGDGDGPDGEGVGDGD